VKWIGPFLLLIVVAFGFTSFYARQYVPFITVLLILSVLLGVIATIVAEVKDARKKERESIG
jgi:hypothetical protein